MIFHALPESNPFFANALSRPRVLLPNCETNTVGFRKRTVVSRGSLGGVRLGKKQLRGTSKKSSQGENVGCKAVSVSNSQKSAPCV